MMQVVLHQFPGAQVEYRFKCRNPGVNLAAHVSEIRDEIRSLCSLHFQDAELAYLRTLRFIKSDFVDFLGLFRLNEKYITVTALPSGEIDITIRGPWLHTILFEIPVLAIVNEVYFRNTHAGARFRRRPQAARPQDRAAARRRPARAQDRRLRHPPALFQGLARGGAARADCAPGRGRSRTVRRHQQRAVCHEAGPDAPGHHGARIPAGLPGAGPAPARQPGVRVRVVGQGIPRRPGHRAVRRVRHERLPARLRHVFLQAVRRRAPRQRRPVCLGRAPDRTLPQEPGRPADQDADLQRQPDCAAHHRAVPAVSRPLPAGLRHRHQPDQRPG
jgi:hypothetical protein